MFYLKTSLILLFSIHKFKNEIINRKVRKIIESLISIELIVKSIIQLNNDPVDEASFKIEDCHKENEKIIVNLLVRLPYNILSRWSKELDPAQNTRLELE